MPDTSKGISEYDYPDNSPLEELGGTIVYDSQANLTGCPRIESYFEQTKDNSDRKMDP